jgi:cysteinyl-tRNA synthetase
MLKLKNTYSKSVELFQPNDSAKKSVLMYTCGPTVYSFAHIGNFRSFLAADVLRRTLERFGYSVRQVMNITDVGHMTQDHIADASGEDKLSKAGRELGWDPYHVAAHFERAFVEDAKALRLAIYEEPCASDPALHPRATGHVAEMLVMIQRLLERGYAYVDSHGQAYFDVAKFPEYGALSGKVLDELEAGARVAVREEKRDPRDFALWKVDEKHLMQWDPHGPKGWPAGDYERFRALAPSGVDARLRPGFPGWHIECSAMSRAHLGPVIDIHTGGEDNIFPHHECEIAQSYGARDADDAPRTFDGVLAVLERRVRSGIVSKGDLETRFNAPDLPALDAIRAADSLDAAKIDAMILRRHAAKKAKDFATADALRKELDQRGVLLEDLPTGVRWRLK